MNDDQLDDMIKRRVAELDHVHPPGLPSPVLLWHSLQGLRAQRKDKKHKALWQSAAAALIVLTTGYALFLVMERPGPGSIADGSVPVTWSAKEQRALDLIDQYCAISNSLCQTRVMQDLRSDLERSSRKLDEIDQQLRIYGNDAGLIRARARIERHQARIIKTIIQTL